MGFELLVLFFTRLVASAPLAYIALLMVLDPHCIITLFRAFLRTLQNLDRFRLDQLSWDLRWKLPQPDLDLRPVSPAMEQGLRAAGFALLLALVWAITTPLTW